VVPSRCALDVTKIAAGARSTSLFAERSDDLIVDWPDEIGNHSSGGGLNESLNRHSGDELETCETGDLAIRDGNPDGVVSRAALLILAHVCRDPAECAVEFGRSALVKCGKAHDGRLTEAQLVDILRLHFRLDRQRFVSGTISMIGSPWAVMTPPCDLNRDRVDRPITNASAGETGYAE
jgi:hypothetical protein